MLVQTASCDPEYNIKLMWREQHLVCVRDRDHIPIVSCQKRVAKKSFLWSK